MDGRGRLVDLDHSRTRVDQPADLRGEDRHERLREVEAVGVGLASAAREPPGQRERARQRDLQRAVGPGSRRAEFRDDAQTVRRGDRLEDAEAVLLVVAARAQPTVRRQWLDARQVPIELGGEEARAAHLAVGHDIDAGVGLVAQRKIDGVIEHLRDIRGTQLPASGGIHRQLEPARPGVRPDDGRREWRGAVVPSSSRPRARGRRIPVPGSPRTGDARSSLAEPVLAQGVAERAEQPREPGRSAERRPVTTARGIDAQHDVVDAARPRPATRGAGACRSAASPQRKAPSYSSVAPVAQQLPVVAAIDDLVDVAQRDVRGVHAAVRQHLDLLEARPCRPRSG